MDPIRSSVTTTPRATEPAAEPAAAPQEQEQPTPRDSFVPDGGSRDGAMDRLRAFALRGGSDGPQPQADPTTFSRQVRDHFEGLDADRNGSLSQSEIDTAMRDRSITGDTAAAVATLRDRRDGLEEMHDDEIGDENDGVTLGDISEYERRSARGEEGARTVDGRFADASRRIRETSRDLFPNGAPHAESLQQGAIGDCYFLSAVGARASQDPDAVRRMIDRNDDGTYTVHLGRGDQTIEAPTDSEIGYGATAGRDGLWGTVLERAYAQERHGGSRDGHAYDSIDGAQPASEGVEAVTGHSANTDDLSFTRLDTTRSRLESAMSDGRVTTAQIRPNLPFTEGRRDNGLPMGHIYSVVGFDREHDTVTLRNPWGHTEVRGEGGGAADGTDDGTFTMPLSQFDESFTTVAYEER